MTRLLICLLGFALAIPAWGQSSALETGHPALISVTGKSEIWVKPDQIEFSVHLASEHGDAGAAMTTNQQQVDKLRLLLGNFAVEPNCFQVTAASLVQREREKTHLKYFEASRQCAFTLSSVEQRERLLLAIANSNVGEVRSTQLGLKDPISVRERARLQALLEARRKARAMASCLQQSIGKAYLVEELNPEQSSAPNYSNNYTAAPPTSGLSGLGLIQVEALVRVAFLLQ